MTSSSNHYKVSIGQSFPIGATKMDGGINFVIYSKHATAVDLLLFDQVDDLVPSQVIKLDKTKNKTYHYWHVFVEGISTGQLYGYRIYGPYLPDKGHRFDPSKVILDPYGKSVAIPKNYDRKALSKFGNDQAPSMKSVIVDLDLYDWEGDLHPKTPFSQTIIYELHVGGFTKNPNSGVDPVKRGTFLGLIDKIPYLKELGITAVELLPVFQFDVQDAPEGLTNYWGYSPVSFFSLHQGYSSDPDNPLQVLDDFRDMVKAFHKAGIEVILDVVFNHTAENKENGPTYSFRGIDNSVYYLLNGDKSQYKDYSGTGNTLNANQSIVRRLILSSLHFWVRDMHIDGFRFDLASILSRDEYGNPVENPPILWDIESDPVFAGTKLIAEAWDAAGLYQVGTFIGDSWKEWNGKFRDDIRGFLNGQKGKVSEFVTRLIGSPDLYQKKDSIPEQSINFVTCHDGFTLNDLVSYNEKHNEANGEKNRDGHNENFSWNFGIEGPTDNPKILALRRRQMKNFHVVNLLSMGAPMILMGDEVCRTQMGNNNAYCQDNEIAWFDWSLVEKNQDMLRFVKMLIQTRLRRGTAHPEFNMSLKDLLNQPLITWHGAKLNQPDWSYNSHSIAVTVISLNREMALHYIFNAYHQDIEFELPTTIGKYKAKWRIWIDTAQDYPNDICSWNEAKPIKNGKYLAEAHSTVILLTQLGSVRK
jgi:glycogen operon protein